MKTAGSILKDARLTKNLTITQVEQATKIRAKFIESIERDELSDLPSLLYAKGFIKNYCDYLELDSNTVLAFFRRQTKEIPKSSLLPKGVAEPLNRNFFRLTPGRFLTLLAVLMVIIFLTYFGWQYRELQQSPPLLVESPVEKMVTHERRIEVIGKTDNDATVMINSVSVSVRSDGKFFDQLVLESGSNNITITATSRLGKSTTIKREVVYRPQ